MTFTHLTMQGRSGDITDARSNEMDDEQLIQGILSGNRSSARALYGYLLPVVDRTLRRVLGRREEEHSDLVQQSFEQIVKTILLHQFAGACNLRSWAAALTAKIAFSELRRRYKERRLVVEDPIDLEQLASLDWRDQDAVQAELDQLRRALSTIKPERAIVVYLHDVEGHRLSDISVILETSVTAVQSRLVRGRTQLLERHRMLEAGNQDSSPTRSENMP